MSSKGIIDSNPENPKKVVVGVDFGTSGTGFSFMFVADKTSSVHNYQDWDDCGDNKYCKNISAILYEKSEETPEQWGYTAQKEYLTQDDDDSDSDDDTSVGTTSTAPSPTSSSKKKVLFKFFKNDLKKDHNGHLEQDGLKLPVKEVTTEYLRYIKDLIMDKITQQDISITSRDIRWCFSVPVVWEETHKKEFRKIIFQAGFIDDEDCPLHDFMMVAEPEAAAIYCIDKDQKKSLQSDKIIMIIDAGGGTVDITVHKLDSHCRLKTVTIPSGNMYGSTALDNEFINILVQDFTQAKFDKFKKENPIFYLELLANWEKAKRDVKDVKKPIKLNVPPLLSKLVTESKIIDQDTFKLKLSGKDVERIFQKPVDTIVSQVKEQLKETKKISRKPVDFIFLVGGFGQSEVLRKRLKEECETPTTRLIMPKFSGEAVVNGACLLGRDPSLIQTRRSKYTYGVEVEQVFNNSLHEENRCVSKGGEFVVPGVFKTYAKKGEEIETNRVTQHKFSIAAGQTEADIKIFYSPKEKVKYVDEKTVGLLQSIPVKVTPKTTDQDITVLMKFGEAEVLIEVVQEDGTTVQGEMIGNAFQSLKL